MYNHAPQNYESPFQRLVERRELDGIHSNEDDIIYEDDQIAAFVCSRTEPKNQGNVLVVPKKTYENIYDIPDELLAKIQVFAKQVAIAMKQAYGCDGVSLRQHNEPAGNQEVWHYHLHVIPRYEGDELYVNYPNRTQTDPVVRREYAAKLKEHFSNE